MAQRQALIEQWQRFITVGLKWKWYTTSEDDGRFDFRVTIPCSHSECDGPHTLGVWVDTCASSRQAEKELRRIAGASAESYSAEPTLAVFGNNPAASVFFMSHGGGGGRYAASQFMKSAEEMQWAAYKVDEV